jgi:hypothetical protein
MGKGRSAVSYGETPNKVGRLRDAILPCSAAGKCARDFSRWAVRTTIAQPRGSLSIR